MNEIKNIYKKKNAKCKCEHTHTHTHQIRVAMWVQRCESLNAVMLYGYVAQRPDLVRSGKKFSRHHELKSQKMKMKIYTYLMK